MKFSTSAVHTGVRNDSSFNSVTTPIYSSSNFSFDKIGVNKGFDYTRSANPTRAALEENINELEGGDRCLCTCTGMSAETAVLHLLKPGDHVITGNDIYGGSFRLMYDVFGKSGIDFTFLDMREPDNVRNAVTEKTRMIWIETPSNPLLNIVDISAITAIAQEKSIITVVDNTFMSPYFQQPIKLGADIVLHSTTKYINGHSDVVGGAIVSSKPELSEKIAFLVNALGLGESPWDSWLVLRGVKTLPIRMEAHAKNALAIAEFLNEHPQVMRTWYPGLPSHPQFELACRQMSGFGGMISFEVDRTKEQLDTFFSKLHYFSLAESLGGVESLIESPWYMSHASMSEEARTEAGITPGVIRVSAGIEDSDDLIDDLKQSLE